MTPLRVAIYAAGGLVLLSALATVLAFLAGIALFLVAWAIVFWWLGLLRPRHRRSARRPPLGPARRGLL